MTTRRSFIRSGSAVLASTALFPSFASRAFARRGVVAEGGLFFDQSALDGFKVLYRTPMFAGLRGRIEGIDRAAERKFLREEIRYNDQLVALNRVANLAIDMAFHNMLTGDGDAAELAVSCMDALARFEKWDYFLEGGDRVFGLQRAPAATVATSFCWDWLEGVVDVADRQAWLRIMGERGCEPNWLACYGMRYPDRVEGWTVDETSTIYEDRPERIDLSNWPIILDRTNLKAVPASALAIGAVAYARGLGINEADDERLAKWLEQAEFSLRTFGDLYAADGSYDEGVSYANYTSSHIAQATVVLERYNGTELYDEINWAGYVDYLCGMSMATAAEPSAIVNFGDAGGGSTSSVAYLIAAREGDGKAQWFGDVLAREHDHFSLLWKSGTRADAPPVGPSQGQLWHSALDWVVARTGYRPDDLVVGMRSGGPSNHEHADRNSIVVKWGGEILIADPRSSPYAYIDPSWMMRTTAGHSALLIDGEGHQYHDGREGTNPSDARARIVRIGEREGYMFWTSDATEAYALVNEDIASVTRTVYVFPGMDAVLMVDTVLKHSQPSTIEARFFGDNRDGGCTIEAGSAANPGSAGGSATRTAADAARLIVRRPLASVLITAVSTSGVDASRGRLPIAEEKADANPFGSLTTRDAAQSTTMVTLITPYRGSTEPEVSLELTAGGTVEVAASHGTGRVRCTVRPHGPISEVLLG